MIILIKNLLTNFRILILVVWKIRNYSGVTAVAVFDA